MGTYKDSLSAREQQMSTLTPAHGSTSSKSQSSRDDLNAAERRRFTPRLAGFLPAVRRRVNVIFANGLGNSIGWGIGGLSNRLKEIR